MHPGAVAKRLGVAHNRVVDAVGVIASTINIDAYALTNIQERSPDVQRVKEWEAMADWLEAIAQVIGQLVADRETQVDLRSVIAAATDEQLLGMPGVGEKSLEALRTWSTENSGVSDT